MSQPRKEDGESGLQMAPAQDPPSPQSKSLDEPVLCLRLRFWWFLTLFNQVFLVILMIGCLSTPKWVKQGAYYYQWEGGVISCTTCTDMVCVGCGAFDNELYTDLKEDGQCDVSPISKSFCSAFDDLASAGGVYFFFEILSLILLFIWMTRVAFLLFVKACCPRQRWLAYIYPGLALLFHLLAVIIWAGISEAKFDGDCENDSFDGGKPDLCATHGPALAVFTIFYYAISVGLFVFPYLKSVKSDTPPKADESSAALGGNMDPLSSSPQAGGNQGSPRRFTPMALDEGAGAQLPSPDYYPGNRV